MNLFLIFCNFFDKGLLNYSFSYQSEVGKTFHTFVVDIYEIKKFIKGPLQNCLPLKNISDHIYASYSPGNGLFVLTNLTTYEDPIMDFLL